MNTHEMFASQIATGTAEAAEVSMTSTAARCDLPTTATGTAIRTATGTATGATTEGVTAATAATGETATETGEATEGATTGVTTAMTDGTATTGGTIATTETGGIEDRQVRECVLLSSQRFSLVQPDDKHCAKSEPSPEYSRRRGLDLTSY